MFCWVLNNSVNLCAYTVTDANFGKPSQVLLMAIYHSFFFSSLSSLLELRSIYSEFMHIKIMFLWVMIE